MNVVNFGSLFDFQKKSKIKAGDGLALTDGKFPFFTSSNILSKSLNDYNFEGESLIFGTGGSASIHYWNERFSASTDCFVTMPKVGVGIYTKYVYYFLSGNIDLIESGFKGAGLKHVSKQHISDLKIPVTNPHKQKKIAAILDAADEYRQKTKALIDKYDQLTQSLFKDMFGEMVYHTIGELIERKVITLHKDGNYGGMYPRKNEFGENGIPFLSAKHINDNGGFNFQNVPLLNHEQANKLSFGWIEKGDVLLSHNASVGKVALYNGEFKKALIGTSLTCFRTEKALMNPYFLAFAFRSLNFQSQLRQNMGQTTRNQVPITAQKKLTLPTPVIHLQNQFAKRVELIEKQKQQAEASLVKAEELFNSLLQRAFKGELTN